MAQVRFAVLGDSHVGYKNGGTLFKRLLQQAVRSGNKRFVIFGGDNEHGGGSTGKAESLYREFKSIATGILVPKKIKFRASVGNWEDNTRALFKQYIGTFTGQTGFPGTQGKVRFVWLDNADGTFSMESLELLRKLSPKYHYIIDFHWPLKLKGVKYDKRHVLSKEETDKFFDAIPSDVKSKIVAIFSHHAHAFLRISGNILPDFPKTKFFVCGCSGAFKRKDRGFYDAVLTIRNKKFTVNATKRR